MSVSICPWCKRRFANVHVARVHARSACRIDGQVVCPTKMSKPRIVHPIQRPRILTCRICNHKADSVDDLLDHIVHHYESTQVPSSSSDSESTSDTSEYSSTVASSDSSSYCSSDDQFSSPRCSAQSKHGSDVAAVLGLHEGQGKRRQVQQETENTESQSVETPSTCLLEAIHGHPETDAATQGRSHSQRDVYKPFSRGTKSCSRHHSRNERHRSPPSSQSYLDVCMPRPRFVKAQIATGCPCHNEKARRRSQRSGRAYPGMSSSRDVQPDYDATVLVDKRFSIHRVGLSRTFGCNRRRDKAWSSSSVWTRKRDCGSICRSSSYNEKHSIRIRRFLSRSTVPIHLAQVNKWSNEIKNQQSNHVSFVRDFSFGLGNRNSFNHKSDHYPP